MEKNKTNLNVPHLRFPEFSGEWENLSLNDIVLEKKKRVSSSTLTTSTYISTENMLQNFAGVSKANGVPSNNVVEYKIGDILISNIRPYLKKIWLANQNGGCSSDIIVLSPCENYDGSFVYYLLANDGFVSYVMSGAKGLKMPRGDKQQILKYGISIPSLKEQRKIAALLDLFDQHIETQKKIIEKYESLIRGLITYVNNGKVGRCEKVCLRELLIECHEKNSDNHEVCSVSVSHGVINQVDYLGRSFAAKEVLHYNVVNYGDIIYTKSPTGDFPYGIIKRSDIHKPVAVSPLYGVYRPINDYIGRYLHLYFKSPINAKNYLHRLIQKGAKNTINITNQHFLNNKIQIPEPDVLEVFVHAASEIEKKILAENRALASFEKQKNYLLSKMFI